MKKYLRLVAILLVTLSIATTPVAGFAYTGSNYGDNNGRAEVSSRSDWKYTNPFWNRIFSWFRNHTNTANAQTGNGGTKSTSTQNTRTMPVISGIKSPTVLPAGQVGTWTVNAYDPQNGSLTYAVDWGDTPMSMKSLFASPQEIFTQTSTFTHAYAEQGTYTVKFTVSNDAGQKTTSTVTVHITKPPLGLPVISDLFATSTKPRQAKVTWTTDVNANSSVWLSTTTPVNTSGDANIIRNAKIKNHSINLTKLEPNTLYYVIVGSENSVGETKSGETSFVTPPIVNKNSPVITSLTGSTTIDVGETEEVTVNAFDPKNGPLEYSVDWGDSMTMMKMALSASAEPIFVQTSTFTHVYETPGTYTATFKVKNDAGLEASASLTITVNEGSSGGSDETAPVISGLPQNISAEATSSAGVSVSYSNPTAIDDVDGSVDVSCAPPSGSLFALGSTTVVCSASDSSNNTREESFVITVADTIAPVITLNGSSTVNLLVGDIYNELGATATDAVATSVPVTISGDSVDTSVAGTYQVKYDAMDTAGNNATQVIRTVIVGGAPADTAAPLISSISELIGASTSTVSWLTDEPSNSKVFYSINSPVDITSSSTPFVFDGSLVTNHSIDLSSLATSTLYHFVVESADASNNMATSSELTFTTSSM